MLVREILDELGVVPKAVGVLAGVFGLSATVASVVAGRPWSTITLIVLAAAVGWLVLWRLWFARLPDGSRRYSVGRALGGTAVAAGLVAAAAAVLMWPLGREAITGKESDPAPPLAIERVVVARGDAGETLFEFTLTNTADRNTPIERAGLRLDTRVVEQDGSEGGPILSCSGIEGPVGYDIDETITVQPSERDQSVLTGEHEGGALDGAEVAVTGEWRQAECGGADMQLFLPTSWVLAPGETVPVFLGVSDDLMDAVVNGNTRDGSRLVLGRVHFAVESTRGERAEKCEVLDLTLPPGESDEPSPGGRPPVSRPDCGTVWAPF